MGAGIQTMLPTFQISSVELAPDAAFSLFERATKDIFHISLPGRSAAAGFAIEMTAWHLGTVMLGSVRASALCFERSPEIIMKSGMDHIMVQLYQEGGFIGTASERDIAVRPGDICVFDLTQTLNTQASDFHNITILVPRTFFEGEAYDMAVLNALVLDGRKPLTKILAAHIWTLAQRISGLSVDEAVAIARGTVALIIAAIAGAPWRESVDASRVIGSPIRNIVSYIDKNLARENLKAEVIAAEFGMSRATLYRTFEPFGGVSDYIRRRRLARAALDLASLAHRGRRISQIAFAWGFKSEAVFSRNFRNLFGMSPAEARNRADRVWAAQDWKGEAKGPERNFIVWMKTLRNEGTSY